MDLKVPIPLILWRVVKLVTMMKSNSLCQTSFQTNEVSLYLLAILVSIQFKSLVKNLVLSSPGIVATQKSRENQRKLGKTLLPPDKRGKLGRQIFFISLSFILLFIVYLFLFCFVLGGKFPSFPHFPHFSCQPSFSAKIFLFSSI